MKRSEVKRLITSARNHAIRIDMITTLLFNNLQNEANINLDDIKSVSAENANSLAEAILCHIQYGECDLEDLLDEIMQAQKIVPQKDDIEN